jgi:anti-sigma regulatory factor (Ser/Thr protein kinase)
LQLAASELVANAQVHADSDADVFVRKLPDGGVRIEVVDYGPGRPVMLEPPPEADRGRGLAIVAAAADAWGIVVEDTWKAVWLQIGS